MRASLIGIILLSSFSMSAFADSSFALRGVLETTGEECAVIMQDQKFDFESYKMTYSSPNQTFSEDYRTMKSLERGDTTSNKYKDAKNNYLVLEGGASIFPEGTTYRFKYKLQKNRFSVERQRLFAGVVASKKKEVCILDI